MSTCFFIGHRDAPESVQEKLNETVNRLVKEFRVTDFIVGHYGEFDRMAVRAVQQAVCLFPEKELNAEMLEPYFLDGQYGLLPHYFDGYYYPGGLETVPRRYCIEKANQLTLDQADFLVAYVVRDGGNAAKLLRRARKMEKKGYMKVINLAQME